MSVPDELLMAYADGELSGAEHAAERARVEAAIQSDPALANRVEQHRALRAQLKATFDPVLDEPVPDRLLAAARNMRNSHAGAPNGGAATSGARLSGVEPGSPRQRSATVTDIGRARAARESAARAQKSGGAIWSWPQWGAIAVSLIIGVIIGHLALQTPDTSPIVSREGRLVAQNGLAEALSTQLASTQPADAPVQIGTSFKAKSGAYCRTFVLHEGEAIGGLACRNGDAWDVHTLARAAGSPAGDGGYRPAASEMPAAVRTAVEDEIVGDPLDSGGERQAKQNQWK